jgi:hypothetical protein
VCGSSSFMCNHFWFVKISHQFCVSLHFNRIWISFSLSLDAEYLTLSTTLIIPVNFQIRRPPIKPRPRRVNNMVTFKSKGWGNVNLIHLTHPMDRLRASYFYSQDVSDFQKVWIHSLLSLSTNALLQLAVAAVVAIHRMKRLCRLCEQITTRVSVIPSFDTSIPRHKYGG